MGNVKTATSVLLATIENINYSVQSMEDSKRFLQQKVQQVCVAWNHRKSKDLVDVVQECTHTMNRSMIDLLNAEKYLMRLLDGVREYEETVLGNGTANGPALSRHWSSEQARTYMQSALETINQTIEDYHDELVSRGIYDGAMLVRFLQNQKNQMLNYEHQVTEAACRNRPPLNDNEVYHYVVVGENSPFNYENLANAFSEFCMEQINSWIAEINPNPNNDPRRDVNCGKCAAAVYCRLNGDDTAVADLGTYSISEMNSITGRVQTSMTPTQIEAYLREQGAGSHVVVGVDRSSGAGHWFNAFFDGNSVYTIEGQGGLISGWPPDYGDVVHWDASI